MVEINDDLVTEFWTENEKIITDFFARMNDEFGKLMEKERGVFFDISVMVIDKYGLEPGDAMHLVYSLNHEFFKRYFTFQVRCQDGNRNELGSDNGELSKFLNKYKFTNGKKELVNAIVDKISNSLVFKREDELKGSRWSINSF